MFKIKKGVLLIYAIAIITVLAIFATVAMNQMQNSTFLTKRFTGETKAYWASRAGLEYAQYNLKKEPQWPFTGEPGTGDSGDIIIKDCTNFRLVYDPSELAGFIAQDKANVKVTEVYCHRL